MKAQRRIARTRVLAALTLALAAGGATGAKAQEGVFMKNMLGQLGFIEKDHAPITYRERAPLVLPPRSDLPPPVDRTAARGEVAWPKDPEVKERESRAARERVPAGLNEQGRMNDNRPMLSIYEMRAGRRPGAEVPSEATYKPGDNNRASFWLDPLEMLKGKKDGADEASGAEPNRVALTQPPTGYRRPPGGIEKAPSTPKAYNIDRDEADPGLWQREQAKR